MQRRQLHWRPPGPSRSTGWHRRALQAQPSLTVSHCLGARLPPLQEYACNELMANMQQVMQRHRMKALFQDQPAGSRATSFLWPVYLDISWTWLAFHQACNESGSTGPCSCRRERGSASGVLQCAPRAAGKR